MTSSQLPKDNVRMVKINKNFIYWVIKNILNVFSSHSEFFHVVLSHMLFANNEN